MPVEYIELVCSQDYKGGIGQERSDVRKLENFGTLTSKTIIDYAFEDHILGNWSETSLFNVFVFISSLYILVIFLCYFLILLSAQYSEFENVNGFDDVFLTFEYSGNDEIVLIYFLSVIVFFPSFQILTAIDFLI